LTINARRRPEVLDRLGEALHVAGHLVQLARVDRPAASGADSARGGASTDENKRPTGASAPKTTPPVCRLIVVLHDLLEVLVEGAQLEVS